MYHEYQKDSNSRVFFISILLLTGLFVGYYYSHKPSASPAPKNQTTPTIAQVSSAPAITPTPLSKKAHKIAVKAQKIYTDTIDQFKSGFFAAALPTGEAQKQKIQQVVLAHKSSSWFATGAEPYTNYVHDAYSQEKQLKHINKKLNKYKHEDQKLSALYDTIETLIDALSYMSIIIMGQDNYFQEKQFRSIRNEIAWQADFSRAFTPTYYYSFY